MLEKIKNNPARVLGVVLGCAVAIGAAVGVDLNGPVDTIAAIAGILLGTEVVRSKVTPTRKGR